jgi:G3E family GTPase
VDAVEFVELYESGMYGNFFREQIESSDAVLVNKVDIAEAAAIFAAERLIGEINPRAVLFRTKNAEMDVPLPEGERKAGKSAPLFGDKAHCRFETLSFRVKSGVQKERVRQFFDELAKDSFGSIARAKALVQTDEGAWRFDVSYGKVDAVRFEKNVADGRIVVIGEGLSNEGLKRALEELN